MGTIGDVATYEPIADFMIYHRGRSVYVLQRTPKMASLRHVGFVGTRFCASVMGCIWFFCSSTDLTEPNMR